MMPEDRDSPGLHGLSRPSQEASNKVSDRTAATKLTRTGDAANCGPRQR